VLVVRKLQPLAVEMVVRGYLTGSLWRDYQAGKGAQAYGVELPEGMRKDQKFEKPILTPSTKEQVGKHDEPSRRGSWWRAAPSRRSNGTRWRA